jgi:hypothetical protein
MPYAVHYQGRCQHDVFFEGVVPDDVVPVEANDNEAIVGYYAIIGE